MPTDPGSAGRAWRLRWLGLTFLLVLLSLPDLLSPPISPTILRQTQTFSQTRHLAENGFSPGSMAIDIDGPHPFRVVYEFPVYQTLAGLCFKLGGAHFFWGKLISLVATAAGFALALQLARRAWGESLALRAGFLLAASPITLLVSAAFQPDALALALGAAAGALLCRWSLQPSLARWSGFLLVWLLAALAKFTVLVPFLPLAVGAVCWPGGKWRRPRLAEIALALGLFAVPFVAWNLHRATLMDPRYLVGENAAFFVGDLSRFLSPGFYVKPAFILGAMVLCGAGVPLALLGGRGWSRPLVLLAAGVPLYYVLLPTAAEQTYYAWPLVPALAVFAARGWLALEERWPQAVVAGRTLLVAAWIGGFAIAAPYTLRHDRVSLAAATALAAASQADDLILVLNTHDRGVGIGGFNPTIFTLAGRRGWNLSYPASDLDALRRQVASRRAEGARWLVVTWFTPELDPWFTRWLPAGFSRQPRVGGQPVDGRALAAVLDAGGSVVARGDNFAILRLD